jgi:hypothetical protein
MACGCAAVGLLRWFTRGQPEWAWFFVAAGFGILAAVYPASLSLANRAWTAFGLLLSRLVSPFVIAVMFFAVLAPIGILLRLAGKQTLQLKFDESAATYWIRKDSGPAQTHSMKHQF